MSGSDWIDVTSYSRGERGHVEPRVLELRAGKDVRPAVTLHRMHGMPGWFLTIHPITKDLELGDVSAEEAKDRALREAESIVDSYVQRWERLLSAIRKEG